MKWNIYSYMPGEAYWYFWQESANGRWAKREKELPTVHLQQHVITVHACMAKKGFAVWIWILAVQMSLGAFWQISTVQGIGQVTIFFFLWLLLSNLNKLTQMAGFLALTPLNAQLDWPTKSRSELRELTVIMKSYEK